jgi:two-component system, NarL family, nitrate/nitrite sensor histidine kinase NarX
MKPKIQIVGGCASNFDNEVPVGQKLESSNHSGDPAILGSTAASSMLEGFLETILGAVGASAGVVRVLSPDGLVLRTVGCAGVTAETCQSEFVVDANCGACGKAASEKTLEASDVEFCKNRYGAKFFGGACKFLLAVPLGTCEKEKEPTGVLTLFFTGKKDISDETRHTLKSYADLICTALKNIWQHEDVYQTNILVERQSIANEIHDSLAQTLYFAKMRSSLLLEAMKSRNDTLAYKCAQDIEESLNNSQRTVRELVTHFRCQMDPRGLIFALQKLANDFVVRTGMALEYDNQVAEFNLPLEYELQVFLIVRESLVNIATHSGASKAKLTVRNKNNQFQFVVEDNGTGVAKGAPPEGHYGLAIMRERALRIGGEVEVKSLRGQGTRVQLTFNAPVISLGT